MSESFKTIFKKIEIGGKSYVKKNALDLLAKISNTCYYNTETNYDLEELENVLNELVFSINYLDEKNLIRYYKSIYHIMKYFYNQNNLENISKINRFILPRHFSKDNNTNNIMINNKEIKNVLTAVTQQMVNKLSSIMKNGNPNEYKHVLDLFKILMKIQDQDKNNPILPVVKMFWYVLFKMIRDQHFQICEDLYKIVEKQNAEFSASITIIALSPSSNRINQNIFENLKYAVILLKTLYRTSSDSTLYFEVISGLFKSLLELLCFHHNKKDFSLLINLPQVQIEAILKFLTEDFPLYLTKFSSKDRYQKILQITIESCSLIRQYLKSSKFVLENEFYEQLVKFIENSFKLLEEFKLTSSILEWKSFYENVLIKIYNIAVLLSEKQKDIGKYQKEIVRLVIKYGFKLDGFEFKFTHPKIIPSMLDQLSYSLMEEQKYTECLAVTAFYCLFEFNEKLNYFKKWWIPIKKNQKINDCTMVSVLYLHYKELMQFCEYDEILTEEVKLTLLKFELLAYKCFYPSRIAMKEVFEKLTKFNDIPFISETIIYVFGKGNVLLHDDMPRIMEKTINKIESYMKKNIHVNNCNVVIIKLALSVLYFYKFKNALDIIAKKGKEDLERTMKVMETIHHKEIIDDVGIPKEENDVCEIASAFSNLCMNKCISVLNILNVCRNIMVDTVNKNELEDRDIYEFIPSLFLCLGYEYRLQYVSMFSTQSFYYSLICSKKINDEKGQLKAICELLQSSSSLHAKHLVDVELINQGDRLVKKFEQNSDYKTSHEELIIHYYMNKSELYVYRDPDESYKCWQTANLLLSSINNEDRFQLFRAKLWTILYKLTKNNCDLIKGEHQRHPMTTKLHKAHDIVNAVICSKSLTSSELCIAFDIAYELSKAYKLMSLPEYLRKYAKCFVLFTQKLFLPLRCVSLLLLLAEADLLTTMFDDYKVKMNDVEQILDTFHHSANEENEIIKQDVEICTGLIRELVIDDGSHFKSDSASSPPCRVKGFKYPYFFLHENDCYCTMCASVEYQTLVLESYSLKTLSSLYQKEELAEEFARGLIHIYKEMMITLKSSKRFVLLIEDKIKPDLENLFMEPFTDTLYNFSIHLYKKSLKSEALKVNMELIRKLYPKKCQYIYAYHKALLQKLLHFETPEENDVDKVCCEEEQEVIKKEIIFCTPASKIHPINVSKIAALIPSPQQYSLPKNPRGKKCLFELSPEVVDLTKEKGELKPINKYQSRIFNTPKIKIFSDVAASSGSVTKTTTRNSRKKTGKEMKPSEEGEEEIAKADLDDLDVIEMSMEAVEAEARSNQVKAEMRPRVVKKVDKNKITQPKKKTLFKEPSSEVKNNLFAAVDTETGAIRRSARNRL